MNRDLITSLFGDTQVSPEVRTALQIPAVISLCQQTAQNVITTMSLEPLQYAVAVAFECGYRYSVALANQRKDIAELDRLFQA